MKDARKVREQFAAAKVAQRTPEVGLTGMAAAVRENEDLRRSNIALHKALCEISTTIAPKGSHAEIMKRIADRAIAKAS